MEIGEGRSDKRTRLTVRCPPDFAQELKETALKHNVSENFLYVDAWRYALESNGFHLDLQKKHPRLPRYGYVYDSDVIERT